MTDLIALTEAWLSVMPQGEFDDFPGRVSPDFVLRLPFMPPGLPNEFRGRETAQAVLRQTAQGRTPLVFSNKVIRRTEDSELTMTTCKGEAVMNNGKTYRNEYVILVRIRGDEVVEHVEYLNPLAIMDAAD